MLSVFFYLDTNLKKYSLINAVTLMRGGGGYSIYYRVIIFLNKSIYSSFDYLKI